MGVAFTAEVRVSSQEIPLDVSSEIQVGNHVAHGILLSAKLRNPEARDRSEGIEPELYRTVHGEVDVIDGFNVFLRIAEMPFPVRS
ncbi:hypothetical protein D3C71_1634820 [compost metagenome]